MHYASSRVSELIFGKYELVERLAAGGMGEVFRARQPGLGARDVILKSLLPELAGSSDFVTQFLDEARVVAALNHPNVVSVFDVGVWNGTYYLAMEFIAGITVAELQRKASERGLRVPPRVSAAIVRDAAMGLHHAHEAKGAAGQLLGIVHRDVSPQNLMVRGDGVVKVVDFGIALAIEREARTATGVLKGKLSYMSPEQAAGDLVGAASDQFSLGVVLWELLAGKRLFKGVADLELLKRVLEEPIVRPGLVRDDVPRELDAVVMRALNRRPEKRYESCAALAAALDAAADGRTPTGESPVARFLSTLGGGTPAPVTAALPLGLPRNAVVTLEHRTGVQALALEELAGKLGPPRPYSLLAAASLITGLTCCAPFSVVAMVTGWRALKTTEEAQQGLWMARAGVPLGALGLVLNVGALLLFRSWFNWLSAWLAQKG